MNKLNVLVVDDEQGYRDEIGEYLSDCGFAVFSAEKPSQALDLAASHPLDIAIIDLKLPEMNGLQLMKKLLEIDPEIAVIMISGHGDMNSVIKAMREGAIDFFAKPFNLNDIQYAIQRTQKFLDLQNQMTEMRQTYEKLLKTKEVFAEYQIIGESQVLQTVLKQMNQIAQTGSTDVLITGESGTGKELVARGIHRLSNRKDRIFFDVNCTAIPENLFESEFFGHAKHAFTGAETSRQGWFEIADKGTLFLDEIGDMPLNMQAKLLRVLEERKIRRVGSAQDIHLDFRLIVSTNKDLAEMVNKNLFRKDLFYRLNKFQINLPPLRTRTDDITQLLDHFNRLFSLSLKKRLKPITENTLLALQKYEFPGNVRELKNMVEKAVIISRDCDNFLKIQTDGQQSDFHSQISGDPDNLALDQLEQLEKEMICRAMQQSNNNKTRAAELLRITRTSLNRRIEKYLLQF